MVDDEEEEDEEEEEVRVGLVDGEWRIASRCGYDRGGGGNVPFPFDHFFFCFLPPDAAGACKGWSVIWSFAHY